MALSTFFLRRLAGATLPNRGLQVIGGNESRAELPNPTTAFDFAGHSFSLSMRVRLDGDSGDYQFLFGLLAGNTSQCALFYKDGKLGFDSYQYNSYNGLIYLEMPQSIALGEWHVVKAVFTLGASGNQFAWYLDGQLLSSMPVDWVLISTASSAGSYLPTIGSCPNQYPARATFDWVEATLEGTQVLRLDFNETDRAPHNTGTYGGTLNVLPGAQLLTL